MLKIIILSCPTFGLLIVGTNLLSLLFQPVEFEFLVTYSTKLPNESETSVFFPLACACCQLPDCCLDITYEPLFFRLKISDLTTHLVLKSAFQVCLNSWFWTFLPLRLSVYHTGTYA